MISLPNQLPILCYGDHEVVQYESRWLKDSISRAAAEAGHSDWWFSQYIAAAVIEYLRYRFQGSVITLEDLYGKIQTVLNNLGWHDIASALEKQAPPLRVNLSEIAKKAGAAYELSFFTILQSKIIEMVDAGANQLDFYELRNAVLLLKNAQRWSLTCSQFGDETVSFIRHEVMRQTKLRRAENGGKINLVIRERSF